MTGLRIGEKFTLPLEFVTSTQAILARKRSGKSYTASVEAEELLTARQQIAVIDPTGAWWGLKSSADGKEAGFPVVVFGGEHADVPLESTAGEVLAHTLVEQRFSAVFDLSLMGVAEAIRFVTAFMNELFRVNRAAMHLFIDEADAYCPQKPFGEEAKSLHAVKRLVKQGGIRGIGVTMITQRAQVLNKDVLSQVDILTVLRMSHPLDVKAATDWISSEVDVKFAQEVKTDLPSLPVGTAYVCSAPLHIGERVEIRKRKTFNSGATPKPGEVKIEPKVLAEVDIEQLGEQIAATVERAKANDPKQLQKRIKELESQIGKPGNNEEVVVLKDTIAQLQSEAGQVDAELEGYRQRFARSAEIVKNLYEVFFEAPVPVERTSAVHAPITQRQISTLVRVSTKTAPRLTNSDVNLRAGARRMLAVLAQWYPSGRTESQVAAQVQMKKTGGTWAAYKSDLRNGGYFEVRDGLWFATEAGRDYVGSDAPEMPSTTEDVVRLWGEKLRLGARNMLDVLVEKRGRHVSKDDLGSAIGMEASGGTFSAYLSDLRQAGLILVDRDGVRANKETLFL